MGNNTVRIGASLEIFKGIGTSTFLKQKIRDPRVALMHAEKSGLDFLLVSATKDMAAFNNTAIPWTFWEEERKEFPDTSKWTFWEAKEERKTLPHFVKSKVTEISWAMNPEMRFIDRNWRSNGLVRVPQPEMGDVNLLDNLVTMSESPNLVIDTWALIPTKERLKQAIGIVEQLSKHLAPVFVLNMREKFRPYERQFPFSVLEAWADFTADTPERWIIVENLATEGCSPETVMKKIDEAKENIRICL